ncbi:hypothetical protein DVH24_039057 [Malus domestica]|uniref:Uncharacterized protein n=1 Tax=Malus domestica TaxID=3750 RepID=A0A498KH23_MALDO|nr:hypothetical protein DVH24_039057 [Malus domestica]
MSWDNLLTGKIVVCAFETFTDNREGRSVVVNEGGGVGMILVDPFLEDVGFQHSIWSRRSTRASSIHDDRKVSCSALACSNVKCLSIEETTESVARISPTMTVQQTKPAPEIAVKFYETLFSLLKYPKLLGGRGPDITGPGVNVLAAWSLVATAATAERSVNYITKFRAPRCLARMYLHLQQFLNHTNRPGVQHHNVCNN